MVEGWGPIKGSIRDPISAFGSRLDRKPHVSIWLGNIFPDLKIIIIIYISAF